MARRRFPRRTSLPRMLAIGALCLVAFLYYRPLRAYVGARHSVRERAAQVQVLQAQKRLLERRLARAASRDALIRQARQLSLVKPGERLYIVKGIAAWRHDRATARKPSR